MDSFILIGLFVALGILFRRLEAFPAQTAQVLNMFALYVSLPAVILLKVPQITLSREMLVAAIAPWGMLLLTAVAVLLAARAAGWSREITGVLLLILPVGNTSFMGVPMVGAFFGEIGIPYLIVYDQIGTMLIFALYGSVILAIYGRNSSLNLPSVARRALLFPPTMALLAGILLRSWPYPAAVVAALKMTGGMLTPLVMTAIGFQLRLRLQPTVLMPLGFGLGLKLVFAPLVALAFCRLFGLNDLATNVTIFEAGMPPMVTAGALAIAAGMQAELAAALVSLGIPLAFATLPLLFAIL
ncbi:MAG TPA: AEC family transporter [Geothermobacteraceae bacterium]|nr:AEC family transporter [Geothermobacteraceae bacterium]